MSLKTKAVKSFSWTLFEGVFSQGALFVIGIVLARLLTPDDYGVIGIVSAFIAITSTVVEGGFFTAIVRKNDADNRDYNTMFYTNMAFGILLYLALFFSSNTIAVYFGSTVLGMVLKVAGLNLIFSSFSLIQRAILTKVLNFRVLALISVAASVLGGAIALVLAFSGFGIWSLVALSVTRPLISSLLLWVFNSWRPKFIFSMDSFKALFGYGHKVLISKLINNIYQNVYSIIIGKAFSTVALGYYTRANQFQSPFSTNIALAINRISFPILSKFQEDNKVLLQKFIRFLRYGNFLNFLIMALILAFAKPMVLLLIGEKWQESIYYLQLLCLTRMLYPLQILHLNLLLVKGYSNLNLRLEVIKKIILVPLIAITVFYGIEAMLYGLIGFSVLEYFINSYYTRKLVGYSLKQQANDIIPFALMTLTVTVPVLCIGLLNINLYSILVLQLIAAVILFFAYNEFVKLNEYVEIKKNALDFISKKIKNG